MWPLTMLHVQLYPIRNFHTETNEYIDFARNLSCGLRLCLTRKLLHKGY